MSEEFIDRVLNRTDKILGIITDLKLRVTNLEKENLITKYRFELIKKAIKEINKKHSKKGVKR